MDKKREYGNGWEALDATSSVERLFLHPYSMFSDLRPMLRPVFSPCCYPWISYLFFPFCYTVYCLGYPDTCFPEIYSCTSVRLLGDERGH